MVETRSASTAVNPHKSLRAFFNIAALDPVWWLWQDAAFSVR